MSSYVTDRQTDEQTSNTRNSVKLDGRTISEKIITDNFLTAPDAI